MATARPGRNGLAAGAGVPGDETLDVDRRLRGHPLERLSVGQVVDPVAHAEQFLLLLLVAAACDLCDQFLFARRERANILEPAVDHGCVAIGRDQRVQRRDKAPGWRVDHRFSAGVDVSLRAAAPLLAARDQFQLDDALGSQIDRDVAVDVLPACGNEDAFGLLERGEDIGALHDLVKCGEPISSSPSATSTRLTGSFTLAARMA